MVALLKPLAMNRLITCMLIGALPLSPKAQDLIIEDFFPTGENTTDIQAQARLYCDGDAISINVYVQDDDIQLQSSNDLSDHIRIWLALPEEAYPERFDYQLHPQYITSRPSDYSLSQKARYFSTNASDLTMEKGENMENFFEKSDYPQISRGDDPPESEGNNLPARPELEPGIVPFGLVGYSFFSDNRPPVWINAADMQQLENTFELQLANLVDSIKYYAETTESNDGYTLDISFPAAALGFVQLPHMKHIRLLIEVWNAEADQPANIILSSSENRQDQTPYTFNEVYFQEPLRTNFCDIPDQVFYQTSYYPICLLTENNWVSTAMDVDALVFAPKITSKSLTEIKFYKQNLEYLQQDFGETAVETLRVQMDYVNQFPRQKEYTLIKGETFMNEKTSYPLPDQNDLPSGLFAFPDGHIGLIQRSSIPVDPFGWTNCQTCLEDNITIHRVDPFGQHEMLRMRQGDGQHAYCKVGDLKFDDYQISSLDWISDGKILVIGLKHRYQKLGKRIKVSWEDDGSNMEVVEVD